MKNYYVGRPNVTNKSLFLSRVSEILDSGQFTNNGTFSVAFEELVRTHHNVQHAIGYCNASVALEAVLTTIPPGDVIVPTFTFIATAQAVRRAGHRLVFIDINSNDFGMNIKQLESAITKNTKAIVPVNLFGNICPIKDVINFGHWNGIPVISDSAHGAGMINLGGNGLCEVFSFHATKICNSFEGGMITTNNLELAKKLRAVRNFGYATGEGLPPEGIFHSPSLATNNKMSEIHAAMGLTNFERINDLINHNKLIFDTYKSELSPDIDIRTPNTPLSNYSYVPILVDNQKELTAHLRGLNILVRNYFNYLCSDVMASYEQFPIARSISNRIIHLPTGLSITQEDAKYIAGVINEFNKS